MKVLVTDKPDPNCKWCKGRGIIGGCEGRHKPNPRHLHTISFCDCTNERYEEEESSFREVFAEFGRKIADDLEDVDGEQWLDVSFSFYREPDGSVLFDCLDVC